MRARHEKHTAQPYGTKQFNNNQYSMMGSLSPVIFWTLHGSSKT